MCINVQGQLHGSSGALSVASDVPNTKQSGGPLIPSISCRSTVSDTEYENVSLKLSEHFFLF